MIDFTELNKLERLHLAIDLAFNNGELSKESHNRFSDKALARINEERANLGIDPYEHRNYSDEELYQEIKTWELEA